MRKILLVLILCFAWVTPVQAYKEPKRTIENLEYGDSLLRACKSELGKSAIETINRSNCHSYLRGLTEGVSFMFIIAPNLKTICAPNDGIPQELIRLKVIKLLEEAPEMQQKVSAGVVYFTLVKAFPCKK